MNDSQLSGFETAAPAGTARAAWQNRWRQLAPRERGLLLVAAWLVGLALLWGVAIRPAWQTLQAAPSRIVELERHSQQMRAQAGEARTLRQAPAVPPAEAMRALQAATDQLPSGAKLSLRGERAVLLLNGVPAPAWQEWVAQARSAARARVVEAQLTSGPGGFSGTVTVALPSAP